MSMPSHRVHCWISKILFGRSFYKVHKRMDSAVWFCGRSHRRYFHDLPSALAIACNCYPGDEAAKQAAVFHIQLDFMCSDDPFFRRQIELWAKKESKKRRRSRKKKSEVESDPLQNEIKWIIETWKKMDRIQRLKHLMLS